MSVRSLNKVSLIGNLTRDPELRYTPAGTAVCTFGMATNRSWTTQTGEIREETEFHRIVSWNKLAELCSQLLSKGRKVYVEGRLSTRTWTGQDGNQRTTTEIVIDDMIILDSRKSRDESVTAVVADEKGSVVKSKEESQADIEKPSETSEEKTISSKVKSDGKKAKSTKTAKKQKEEKQEDVKETKDADDKNTDNEVITADDIPF